MEKDFCLGLLMGLVGGGLICANSYRARKAVKDGQEQIIDMLNNVDSKKYEGNENRRLKEQSND